MPDRAKVAKSIPSSMTVVDLTTGKEEHKPMAWGVLPPAKDKCQICGCKHDTAEPHDRQSIYYQMVFSGIIGRPPTWADALAHCNELVRTRWEEALRDVGHWSEPPAGEMPVKHHGVE